MGNKNQFFSQAAATTGLEGSAEAGDRFGQCGGDIPFSYFEIWPYLYKSNVKLGGISQNISLSAAQLEAMYEAAERWEEIIVEAWDGKHYTNDVLSVDIRLGSTSYGRATAYNRPGGLPSTGTIFVGPSDISGMQPQLLTDLFERLFAQVLGFGDLALYRRRNLVLGLDSDNPRFTGTTALQEYNAIFRQDDSSVPLDPAYAGQWRQTVFGNELMARDSLLGSPISRITGALFADLGYRVDLDACDFYRPPKWNGSLVASSSVFKATAPVPSSNLPFAGQTLGHLVSDAVFRQLGSKPILDVEGPNIPTNSRARAVDHSYELLGTQQRSATEEKQQGLVTLWTPLASGI